MNVLVTGATGRVGGQAVAQLAAAGVDVRGLTRDPSAARLPKGVTAVAGDLADPGSLDLSGVDAVFLVFPTLQADPAAPELITTLAKHAKRIVYLSANGADPDAGSAILRSHAMLETLIAESGADWTFLRPSGFAANTLGWAPQIRTGDVLRWYHAKAGRAPIHEEDMAAVGVRALLEKGHLGQAYHLTGPEQLTTAEQVSTIGVVLGRQLELVELDPQTAKRELFGDMPDGFADAIVDGHASFVRHPEVVTDTVPRVLGRPARTYAQWVADHRKDFRR